MGRGYGGKGSHCPMLLSEIVAITLFGTDFLNMDSWGSVPWPSWIYLFFVAEFVLENGLILEQRLIFEHREKR